MLNNKSLLNEYSNFKNKIRDAFHNAWMKDIFNNNQEEMDEINTDILVSMISKEDKNYFYSRNIIDSLFNWGSIFLDEGYIVLSDNYMVYLDNAIYELFYLLKDEKISINKINKRTKEIVEYEEKYIQNFNNLKYIVFLGQKPVGMLDYVIMPNVVEGREGDTITLDSLEISKKYRNRGIGKLVIDELFKMTGKKRMTLTSAPTEEAIGFYESLRKKYNVVIDYNHFDDSYYVCIDKV